MSGGQYEQQLNFAINTIKTIVKHIIFSEKGKILQLYNKWWKQIGTTNCETIDQTNDRNSMNFSNVFGIFTVLIVGVFLSSTATIIEVFWNRKTKNTTKKTQKL